MRFLAFFFIFFAQFAYAININPFYPAGITATWDTTPADGGVLNGPGSWNVDTTSFTYNGGANNSPFCQGCNVVFGGTGTGLAGPVTVIGTQRINNILFDPTDSGTPTYVLSGGTLACVNPIGNCTYTANQNATIGSVISGTKGIIKEGAGNLILSGDNTATGTVDINAGTLTFSTPGYNKYRGGQININNGRTMSLMATGGSYRYDFHGTTFNFDNFGGGSIITTGGPPLNWVLTGRWYFVTNGGARNTIGGTHPINMNNSSGHRIYFEVIPGSDPISDLDVTIPITNSTHSIVKEGTGVLRLLANNTHTGNTQLRVGTLVLGDGVIPGNIIPATNPIELEATLTYNTPSDIIHSGVISDKGNFIKQGTGTITLAPVFPATNTYYGNTTVSAGTLSLGDGVNPENIIPATNKITNNATLTYNTPGTITHSGVISGTGIFNKLGTGTLIFSGTNTYTGETTIVDGTLSLGDGTKTGNIIPAINLITNNATLTYNTPSTISHSGAISGTGIFIKEGTGTITLNGASTYTGGTAINAGTIICGVAGALGTGTVTVNPPGTFTTGPCTNATAGTGTIN